MTREGFRERLLATPPDRRDAWVDEVLGLGDLPDDHDLPPGCVPYLPSPVDALLHIIEHAPITADDVFVDVGSGIGRATMLVHLLTGADAMGLEIQEGLVDRASSIATALGLDRVSTIRGDAEELVKTASTGSVFFFYCPFGTERLVRVLEALRALASAKPLRLCFMHVPPPPLSWMSEDSAASSVPGGITVCRTTAHRE